MPGSITCGSNQRDVVEESGPADRRREVSYKQPVNDGAQTESVGRMVDYPSTEARSLMQWRSQDFGWGGGGGGGGGRGGGHSVATVNHRIDEPAQRCQKMHYHINIDFVTTPILNFLPYSLN